MSYCKYCNDMLKISRNKNYNESNIQELDAKSMCILLLEKLNAVRGLYNSDEYIYKFNFKESELLDVDISKIQKTYPEKSELEIRADLKTLYNDIIRNVKTSDLFVLLCTTCGMSYHLKPNTIIDSINLDESLINQDEIPEIRFEDPTLFRTKNYICINKKCLTNIDKSEATQVSKEAAFYKLGKSHSVRYICGCCKMSWNT